MKAIAAIAAALALWATPTLAEGDIVRGERDFGRCMVCHSVSDGTQVIRRGGRTGPNLYGIIGRPAASGDFAYADGLRLAGAAGLVWTEENMAAFLLDPVPFLRGVTGQQDVRSKMSFKMRGGEHVAAYLASLAAQAPGE